MGTISDKNTRTALTISKEYELATKNKNELIFNEEIN